MKLYYNPLSPNCHKVLAALYEKNIPFEGEVVNVGDPAASAAYTRDVNLLGKVPFLLRDDGRRIPESSIIIEYLDAAYDTGPRLIPDDKELARQVRFQDRCADLYITAQVGTIFRESFKGDAASPSVIAYATAETNKLVNLLESRVIQPGQKYLVGDSYTLADISLAAALGSTKLVKMNVAEHPKVDAWLAGIHARPAWQRVTEELGAALKQYGMA